MIPELTYTVEDLVADLSARKLTRFVRWGDGEFACIFGARGANCDGARYTEHTRESLLESLRTAEVQSDFPGSIFALQSFARRMYAVKLADLLRSYCPSVRWASADILHHDEKRASEEGRVTRLLAWLQSRDRPRVVIVGPSPLRIIAGWVDAGFVETHPTQAIDEVARITDEVCEFGRDEYYVALWSCGFAAKVAIPIFAGDDSAHIDVGSIWHPYLPSSCGLRRRRYQVGLQPVGTPLWWTSES